MVLDDMAQSSEMYPSGQELSFGVLSAGSKNRRGSRVHDGLTVCSSVGVGSASCFCAIENLDLFASILEYSIDRTKGSVL
jgi:hypothetical protein